MKKTIFVILLTAAAGAAGVWYTKRDPGPEKARTVRPVRETIAVRFRQTGTVNPRNRLEIKPPLPGRLEDVLVNEGGKVRKGQIIAWMSSTDRAALLDTARAKGGDEAGRWEDVYKPTPIVAPIDGFVIARNREPGQTVAAGDVLLVMADTLIVEATVDETDLSRISLGQTVDLYLDAYPEKTFRGVVEHIAFEASVVNNVTVYAVKIRPAGKVPHLRAGMTATVIVTADERENALVLPVDAVTTRGDRSFVLTAGRTADDRPERRDVETGISDGRMIEIVSGLSEDDIVVHPSGAGDGGPGGRRGPGAFGMRSRRR